MNPWLSHEWSEWWAAVWQLLWIWPAAMAGGWAARRLRLPAVAGALLIGLGLGHSGLGRFSPATYEWLSGSGDPAARSQLRALDQQRSDARARLLNTGASPAAVEQFDEQTASLRQPLLEQVNDRAALSRAARSAMLVLGATVLLALTGARWRPPWAVGLLVDATAIAAASLMSVLVVAASLGGLWLWAGGTVEPDQRTWIIGILIACAMTAVPLRQVRRGIAPLLQSPDAQPAVPSTDEGAQLVHATGWAMLLACWVVLGGLVTVGGLTVGSSGLEMSWQDQANLWMVGIAKSAAFAAVMLIGGAMIGWLLRRRRADDRLIAAVGISLGLIIVAGAHLLDLPLPLAGLIGGLSWAVMQRHRPGEQGIGTFGQMIVVLVAALIGMRLDVWEAFSVWLGLCLWIGAGDGKALGAIISLRAIARQPWRSALQGSVWLSDSGIIMMIAAAMLHDAHLIDGRTLNVLVIVGALTSMVIRPAEVILQQFDSDY